MHPIRKKRLIISSIILLGTSIALLLALYALKQNINLYYTPTQVHQGTAPKLQTFRIGGVIEKGSIHFGQGLEVSFKLTDTTQDVKVIYNGVLPDLFREGQGMVVQGKLNQQGIFIADQVLAKHDAEYMPSPVTTALKKQRRQIL